MAKCASSSIVATLVVVSDGVADVQRTRNGQPETEVLADAMLGEGGVAARTAELAIAAH